MANQGTINFEFSLHIMHYCCSVEFEMRLESVRIDRGPILLTVERLADIRSENQQLSQKGFIFLGGPLQEQ